MKWPYVFAALLVAIPLWLGETRGQEAPPQPARKAARLASERAGWRLWLQAIHDFYRDPDKAQAGLRQAADLGYPRAQHMMGLMAARGIGRTADESEAVEWFRRAAAQQHPLALLDLGCRAVGAGYGDGAARQFRAAVEAWLKLLAGNLDPYGSARAGDFILPDGVPDLCPEASATAAEFERQLVVVGRPKAWDAYGSALSRGEFSGKGLHISPAPIRALPWRLRAAAAGHVGAMVGAADILLGDSPGPAEAEAVRRLLERAGDEGLMTGYVALGRGWRDGKFGTPDPVQAEAWFQRAEDIHFAQSEKARNRFPATEVGDLFFSLGNARGNNDRAARWFEEGARAGDPRAQYYLSLLQRDGDGVPPDPEAARHWRDKAAAAGYADSREEGE